MSVFNVIIKIFLIKTIGFYGEETATRFCIIVIVGFSNRKSMPSTVPLTIFWGDEIGTIGIIMLSCVYVKKCGVDEAALRRDAFVRLKPYDDFGVLFYF